METGIKVGDVMTFRPISVKPDTTLKECAKIMKENHVGSLLITEGEKLVGIATEQDFVRKGLGQLETPEKQKVSRILSNSIVQIGPEEDITIALRTMNDYNIRHLPVLNNGKLVGLITSKDILKIQPHLFETLVEAIELREQERKLKSL